MSSKDSSTTKKKEDQFLNSSTEIDAICKRSAENSPDGGPDRKRSVLGDLTNAVVDTLKGKKDEGKRITRSHSGKLSQESQQSQSSQGQRRSKRQCSKQEDNLEDNSSLILDTPDTTYESAQESLSSTSVTPIPTSETTSSTSKHFGNKTTPGLPRGVTDFDQEMAQDPFSIPQYAQDIFKHFKEREMKFTISKYMDRQHQLSKNMRSILVDWMAEVQESFELNHETLYLAVKLVDMYLSKERCAKTVLQLVGSTALLVAAKYDERIPPAVDDFLYICDDAYTRRELLSMEIKLLKTVQFDLGAPLSYTFLRRYARCSKQSMELLTLARYILELSLLEYDLIDVPDSLMAAAALSLALRMSRAEAWNSTLEYYSGYTQTDFTDLVHRFNVMISNAKQKNFSTIPNKYSHKIFFEVAKKPPLSHNEL